MKQWEIFFTSKARKQKNNLPPDIGDAFAFLYAELEEDGPVRCAWPHYSKLQGKKDTHHCHLNKGKPRYVVVWKVVDKIVHIMEIQYVGTHEKADYARMG